MGRNSKWIETQPDDSTGQIAQRALAARFERVWHYLELAVQALPSETENVHQLRVFARRTTAAMDIFADWIPRRRGRSMRKRIKQIRQTAGAARDFDVLLARWTSDPRRAPISPVDLVQDEIQKRRRAAQRPIEAIYEKLAKRRFPRTAAKLVKRLRLRGSAAECAEHFGCMARSSLAQLAIPYLATAQAELADAEALHAFRIQGKQVRYAMEIFAGAFDDDFRASLYPIVVALQEQLGAFNDHVVAQQYFDDWQQQAESCALRQALEVAIEQERVALESGRQDFVAWWTSERRADLRCRFGRYVDLDAAQATRP